MAIDNNAILGAQVVLQQGDGATPTEVFAAVAGSRNVRLAFGSNEVDTTTADDVNVSGVYWRTYRSGIADVSVGGDFVIKDAAEFNQLIADFLAGTVRNYRVVLTGKGTLAGPMRVTQMDISGEFSDVATFSVTVRAASALTYTPESA